MAHLGKIEVPVTVVVDVQHARKRVKRILSEAQEANRELAQLETALDEHFANLNRIGITLEVDRDH